MSEHDNESQSEHSGSFFGLIWRWRAILGAGGIVTAAIFAGRVATAVLAWHLSHL